MTRPYRPGPLAATDPPDRRALDRVREILAERERLEALRDVVREIELEQRERLGLRQADL